MKLRKLLTYCAMLFVAPLCAANNAVAYQVASPDEAVVLIVTPGDSLYVSVAVDGITYARTTVGLDVRGVGVIGNNATVSAVEQRHVKGEIKVIERTELTAESAADYWLANGGGIAMRIYPKGSDNVPSIEHDNASDISVRYDATTQHLTVDSSSLIETLYIIDVLGRIQPIEALLPARHIELPLHSLHRGVYWLMTSTAQERISSQFIK